MNAVGRAYERLAYNTDNENIELIEYLSEIIDDLRPTVAPCEIQLEAPEPIQFGADRAILVGLIINERGSMLIPIVPAARSGYGQCVNQTSSQS